MDTEQLALLARDPKVCLCAPGHFDMCCRENRIEDRFTSGVLPPEGARSASDPRQFWQPLDSSGNVVRQVA